MTRKHPDLYHNRGTIYDYLEDYGLAVKDFAIANSIDPTFHVVLGIRGNGTVIGGLYLQADEAGALSAVDEHRARHGTVEPRSHETALYHSCVIAVMERCVKPEGGAAVFAIYLVGADEAQGIEHARLVPMMSVLRLAHTARFAALADAITSANLAEPTRVRCIKRSSSAG